MTQITQRFSNLYIAALLAVSISLCWGQASKAAPSVSPTAEAVAGNDDGLSPVLAPKSKQIAANISAKSRVNMPVQTDSTLLLGKGNMVVNEERVHGRLANASVSTLGAPSYRVVDPSAEGGDHRGESGSGKRVSPTQWQLFKF